MVGQEAQSKNGVLDSVVERLQDAGQLPPMCTDVHKYGGSINHKILATIVTFLTILCK